MPVLQDGSVVPLDMSGSGQAKLTRSAGLRDIRVPSNQTEKAEATAEASTPKINFLYVFAGVFLVLILAKVGSEYKNSVLRPHLSLLAIGPWNFITTGVMTMLFIVIAKVTFNKFPVTGITPFVNAV